MPEPITWQHDDRLPEFGYGITNLVPRPTPGIDTLAPAEYVEGWKALHRKIRRYQPRIVALVGVTLWRVILPLLPLDDDTRAAAKRVAPRGRMPVQLHGAELYVLPNPSGRNANFSYEDMLERFRELRAAL